MVWHYKTGTTASEIRARGEAAGLPPSPCMFSGRAVVERCRRHGAQGRCLKRIEHNTVATRRCVRRNTRTGCSRQVRATLVGATDIAGCRWLSGTLEGQDQGDAAGQPLPRRRGGGDPAALRQYLEWPEHPESATPPDAIKRRRCRRPEPVVEPVGTRPYRSAESEKKAKDR